MKQLHIYDFDETLVKTLGPGALRCLIKYMEAVGLTVPAGLTEETLQEQRYQWWDSIWSINPVMFGWPFIEPVYEHWKSANDDINSSTALVTHRSPILQEKITRTLREKMGITMDHYKFGGGTEFKESMAKSAMLADILKEEPGIQSVTVFDDGIHNIKDYKTYLESINMPHELWLVNCSGTYRLTKFDIEWDEPHKENNLKFLDI